MDVTDEFERTTDFIMSFWRDLLLKAITARI